MNAKTFAFLYFSLLDQNKKTLNEQRFSYISGCLNKTLMETAGVA
ncbi:hypothetical protein CU024_1731 [Enterococcus faecium]|nr:hypothetical protein [Enterococcus faecium]MBK4788254.1 hypothetical protein [Enterococcus faecium]MBK4875436.1 hypothetical protein [Enterococcus faecium]